MIKKLFGGLKMNWLTVILFAVVAGVYTGTVMLVPAFYGTSFQDIGITYEWWVIFAVIIVTNCHKNWEAALKCFVFFLISQPLVFLVEVIFGSLDPDLAWMYYMRWFQMTLLTLPGGFIAWYCKKQNTLGGIVLGLGNTIQAVMALYYFGMTFRSFPYHMLSAIVSLGSIIVMTLCIQKERKNRIIAFAVPVILLGVLFIFMKLTGRVLI